MEHKDWHFQVGKIVLQNPLLGVPCHFQENPRCRGILLGCQYQHGCISNLGLRPHHNNHVSWSQHFSPVLLSSHHRETSRGPKGHWIAQSLARNPGVDGLLSEVPSVLVQHQHLHGVGTRHVALPSLGVKVCPLRIRWFTPRTAISLCPKMEDTVRIPQFMAILMWKKRAFEALEWTLCGF